MNLPFWLEKWSFWHEKWSFLTFWHEKWSFSDSFLKTMHFRHQNGCKRCKNRHFAPKCEEIPNLVYFPMRPVSVCGYPILKTDPRIVHGKGVEKHHFWVKTPLLGQNTPLLGGRTSQIDHFWVGKQAKLTTFGR